MFKSSLKPFSMMKTKSESNLAQRFDFVAVDIPLDVEPVTENKNEPVISNEIGRADQARGDNKLGSKRKTAKCV